MIYDMRFATDEGRARSPLRAANMEYRAHFQNGAHGVTRPTGKP
jgi:hypothetical protein